MRQITFILVLFFSATIMGQTTLSPKQLKKKDYQEVSLQIADSILPDKYAMYPKGINGINNKICKELRYPANAIDNDIQGKVILEFIVDENGEIKNIKVFQSVDPELDEEAIRVIKLLETWLPAIKDGKAIKVLYRFPIQFKLS